MSDKLSVGVPNLMPMRHLRLGTTLIALSVFALLILDFVPGAWVSDEKYLNGSVSYAVLGVIFYVAVHVLGLSSLEYFRLPRIHFKTVIALLLASIFVILSITSSDNVHLGTGTAIRGVIFLVVLGFGEEMVSRGLVFGSLRRFGQWKAIVISSFLFGLLHLNLYLGSNWDPWVAYWHVMDTFSWGIFTCTLMIVTRSIWVAVLFHALSDWGVIFDKVSTSTDSGEQYNPSFFDGITSPFFNGLLFIGMALLLLWIDRGSVPKWVKRLALKWKLVEPDIGVAYPL